MTAHLVRKMSIRKVAAQFGVTKSLVQKLIEQQQTEGNLQAKQRGKPQFSYLTSTSEEVRALVAEHPDATLLEFCELFAEKTGNCVSRAAMCRCLQKLELNRKKKHGTVVKLRQKESKIESRVLGENQGYQAKKPSVFG